MSLLPLLQLQLPVLLLMLLLLLLLLPRLLPLTLQCFLLLLLALLPLLQLINPRVRHCCQALLLLLPHCKLEPQLPAPGTAANAAVRLIDLPLDQSFLFLWRAEILVPPVHPVHLFEKFCLGCFCFCQVPLLLLIFNRRDSALTLGGFCARTVADDC